MVKKEEEDNSGTRYEDKQYPFVLYSHAVLRHKTNNKITHFRLLIRLQQLAKRSDHQESHFRVLLMIFTVEVKSYMEYFRYRGVQLYLCILQFPNHISLYE